MMEMTLRSSILFSPPNASNQHLSIDISLITQLHDGFLSLVNCLINYYVLVKAFTAGINVYGVFRTGGPFPQVTIS